MSTKQPIQEILPWSNAELEKLLRDLIAHGTETAKVDFKAEIETGTPEQKAELLKDITAIANTYDEAYGDHGFMIYGVKAKTITGVAATETDTDKFQNTVEQLLKTYISPMPQIYVVYFENATGEKWGAIVIPPRNTKPHMFFKELSCPTNPTKSRKRGESLYESVRILQARVVKTEEQYNNALFKLVEKAVSGPAAPADQDDERSPDARDIIGMDLSWRVKARLRTPKDSLAEDILAEAKAVRDYLDGAATALPWTPQLNDAAESKRIIEDMEAKTRELQLSLATIVLSDGKGAYTDVLLRAVKMLAKVPEVPTGTPYNRIGQSLRYYPLGLILYTIFICGVAANRGDLLKRVMQIPVKHPGRTETSDMTDIFFYWYDAGILFNDASGQRRCAPIADRIRQVIRDHIGEMITEFSEPEYFFRGEFVLALTRIDVGMKHGEGVDHRVPLSGLYLYMHEGNEPITTLLLEHPDWLDKLYDHPLNEILDMFDRNADKVAGSDCIAFGLHGLKTRETYDESLRRRAKK